MARKSGFSGISLFFAPRTSGYVSRKIAPHFAARLRAQPGKQIWMMRGGEIIASFLDQGEIDEFRIHVITILVAQPSGCAIFDRLNEALV